MSFVQKLVKTKQEMELEEYLIFMIKNKLVKLDFNNLNKSLDLLDKT
jgi:hypothetical protein